MIDCTAFHKVSDAMVIKCRGLECIQDISFSKMAVCAMLIGKQ